MLDPYIKLIIFKRPLIFRNNERNNINFLPSNEFREAKRIKLCWLLCFEEVSKRRNKRRPKREVRKESHNCGKEVTIATSFGLVVDLLHGYKRKQRISINREG